MRTYKVGRLPVIDTNKNLQGLVTLTDILRTTAATNNAEATEIEFKGEENVIKTLRSIATRDGATTR
jgi:CBS domain-containing protein